MKRKTYDIVIVAVVAFVLLGILGIYNPLGLPAVLSAAGGGVNNAQIIQSVGGCPATGLADPFGYTTESIANAATGLKTGIQATWFFYTAGATVPFQTGVAASTGLTDLGNIQCGEAGDFVVVNSTATYYPKQVNLPATPQAAQVTYSTVELDAIATPQLAYYNSSSPGVRQTATAHEQVTSSSTFSNGYIGIKANTARGVINKPVVCFNFTTGTLASAFANVTSLYLAEEAGTVGGTAIPTSTCGTVAETDHLCFQLKVDKISDLQEVKIKPVLTVGTFAHVNMTVKVLDNGFTYVAGSATPLIEGCMNPATRARPTYGVTTTTQIISINC